MMNAIRATGNLPEDEEFKGAIAEFKTKFVVSEE
jgi:F-type H+-transporting ATPase subunit alpha